MAMPQQPKATPEAHPTVGGRNSRRTTPCGFTILLKTSQHAAPLASQAKPYLPRPISLLAHVGHRPDPGGNMMIKKSVGVLAIGALVTPLMLGACGRSTTTTSASQAPTTASASQDSTATSTPSFSTSSVTVTEKDFDDDNFPG